jgi:hypothetical protein
LHETTKLQIEKMNEKCRIAANKVRKEVKLVPSDLLWVQLRKDRFPDLRKSKLMTPYKVLAMIMHIHLSCLPNLGLVPLLTFQI